MFKKIKELFFRIKYRFGRYYFVSSIKNISYEELEFIRKHTPRGSHAGLILEESLLDNNYNLNQIKNFFSEKVWMLNSFMDLNPTLSNYAKGTMLRSEFLLLRFLGDREFNFSKKDCFLQFLKKEIVELLPKRIVYRLCDYNNEDFNIFKGGDKKRGARKLLEQQEILELDIEVVNFFRKIRKVDVLVPCVFFAEDFYEIKDRIKTKLGDISTGVMLELPVNLLEIEKYRDADFYMIGPSDLIKGIYGGIDRNSQDFEKTNADLLIPMIKEALVKLDSNVVVKKIIYVPKSLIGKDLGSYKNLELINMYMPSQLANLA